MQLDLGAEHGTQLETAADDATKNDGENVLAMRVAESSGAALSLLSPARDGSDHSKTKSSRAWMFILPRASAYRGATCGTKEG
eukprot:SAG31_NODE_2113_length_6422_cov_2.860035_1_plen_83_part_00